MPRPMPHTTLFFLLRAMDEEVKTSGRHQEQKTEYDLPCIRKGKKREGRKQLYIFLLYNFHFEGFFYPINPKQKIKHLIFYAILTLNLEIKHS